MLLVLLMNYAFASRLIHYDFSASNPLQNTVTPGTYDATMTSTPGMGTPLQYNPYFRQGIDTYETTFTINDIGTSPIVGAFSLVVTLYRYETESAQTILTLNSGNIELYKDNNQQLKLKIGGADVIETGLNSRELPYSAWIMLAITSDTTTTTLYINRAAVGSCTCPVASVSQVTIGTGMYGLINEFMLFDAPVLSLADFDTYYGFGSSCAGCLVCPISDQYCLCPPASNDHGSGLCKGKHYADCFNDGAASATHCSTCYGLATFNGSNGCTCNSGTYKDTSQRKYQCRSDL